MTTYIISIGTLSIKVRSERAHDKGPEKEVSVTIDWRSLRQAWQATKEYSVATIRDLLIRYDEHLIQKAKEDMAQWPPHSLFCEKRCCQRSFNSYIRHLKKEIVFGADGHIK